jgi:hypothetical protein
MEYRDEFEKDFMSRTLKFVREYKGEYNATLIINCLLGLLVVPKETSYDKIPNDPIRENLSSWGLSEECITNYGNQNPKTIRQLVRHLRNSVAHFKIEPIQGKGRLVEGFRFENRSGFMATITLPELRAFVEKLSNHLEAQY